MGFEEKYIQESSKLKTELDQKKRMKKVVDQAIRDKGLDDERENSENMGSEINRMKGLSELMEENKPLRLKLKELFIDDEERSEALDSEKIVKQFEKFEQALEDENRGIRESKFEADAINQEIHEQDEFFTELLYLMNDAPYQNLTDEQKEQYKEDLDGVKQEIAKIIEKSHGIKQHYSYETIDIAAQIATNKDLNLSVEEKTAILYHIIGKFDIKLAKNHCQKVCEHCMDVFGVVIENKDVENEDLDIKEVKAFLESIRRDMDSNFADKWIEKIAAIIESDPSIDYKSVFEKFQNDLGEKDQDEMSKLLWSGSQVHNVGKIMVSQSIWHASYEPGMLHYNEIAQHSLEGFKVIEKFKLPEPVEAMVYMHHFRRPEYIEIIKKIKKSDDYQIYIQAKLAEITDRYSSAEEKREYVRNEKYTPLKALNFIAGDYDKDKEGDINLFKIFLKYLINRKEG